MHMQIHLHVHERAEAWPSRDTASSLLVYRGVRARPRVVAVYSRDPMVTTPYNHTTAAAASATACRTSVRHDLSSCLKVGFMNSCYA